VKVEPLPDRLFQEAADAELRRPARQRHCFLVPDDQHRDKGRFGLDGAQRLGPRGGLELADYDVRRARSNVIGKGRERARADIEARCLQAARRAAPAAGPAFKIENFDWLHRGPRTQ
jgi:hypothetical protein